MPTCINCDSRTGFNLAGYSLEGDKTICANCYEALENFSVLKKYKDIDDFNQTYDLVNKEMVEKNFNQESIDYINDYLSMVKKRLTDFFEEKAEDEESQKFLDDYSRVTKDQIKNHFVTTGFDFQGYKITNYRGVVNGTDIIVAPFTEDFFDTAVTFAGKRARTFISSLKYIQNAALNDAITESIVFGGNAIIGLSFNLFPLGKDMFTIVATGTAVTIEKI